MERKYKRHPFYETGKWMFAVIPFIIAFFTDSSKWILAYGFFMTTFGLIVISEQVEKFIYFALNRKNSLIEE